LQHLVAKFSQSCPVDMGMGHVFVCWMCVLDWARFSHNCAPATQLEADSIAGHLGERAVRAGVDNDTISLGMTSVTGLASLYGGADEEYGGEGDESRVPGGRRLGALDEAAGDEEGDDADEASGGWVSGEVCLT
jgi:hypothetical protein